MPEPVIVVATCRSLIGRARKASLVDAQPDVSRVLRHLQGPGTMDLTYGLETMCVGGGQGMAIVVEGLQ